MNNNAFGLLFLYCALVAVPGCAVSGFQYEIAEGDKITIQKDEAIIAAAIIIPTSKIFYSQENDYYIVHNNEHSEVSYLGFWDPKSDLLKHFQNGLVGNNHNIKITEVVLDDSYRRYIVDNVSIKDFIKPWELYSLYNESFFEQKLNTSEFDVLRQRLISNNFRYLMEIYLVGVSVSSVSPGWDKGATINSKWHLYVSDVLQKKHVYSVSFETPYHSRFDSFSIRNVEKDKLFLLKTGIARSLEGFFSSKEFKNMF